MTVLLPLLVIVLFAGAFAGLASWLVRRELRRRDGWAAEARRLGLAHQLGDPLDLARRLKGVDQVDETVFGTVDGAHVAVVNVVHVTTSGDGGDGHPPTRHVRSVGVALAPSGAPLAVVDRRRGISLVHSPLAAAELEGLLRETAALATAIEPA